MKQRAIDDAEDGRIPPDSKGQRKERRKRETGTLAKGP
jgi:hypothetical protein